MTKAQMTVKDKYGNELKVGDPVFVFYSNRRTYTDGFKDPWYRLAHIEFIDDNKRSARVRFLGDTVGRHIDKDHLVHGDEQAVVIEILMHEGK